MSAEIHALHALAHAVRGDLSRFTASAAAAEVLARKPEVRHPVALGAAILSLQRPGQDHAVTDVVGALREDSYPDAFVTAYRAYPELLRAAARGPHSDYVLQVVAQANDRSLAARLGLGSLRMPGRPVVDDVLTTREVEVAELMALGMTNREIATRLVLSPSTAKVHAFNVMKKLGASTRLGAIARFRELGEEGSAGD